MQTKKQSLLTDVLNGAWGTIGPKSLSSAELIARRVSGTHGIFTHSASTALEAQLRSLEITYGDRVITASYGNPMNAMVTAAAGATPVFADIDADTATLSPASVKSAITGRTKAVIADAPGGNPCDAKTLAAICAEKGIKLIINLGDGYNTVLEGKPLAQYAYGAVLDLSDGCALSAGEGGILVNNTREAYAAAFAYHNCGRTPGEGSTLKMDDIIGGDMRIAEWQAAVAEAAMDELDGILAGRKKKAQAALKELACDWLTPLSVIDGGISSYGSVIFKYNKAKGGGRQIDAVVKELCKKGYNACRPWVAMHRQPVFTTPYFQKVTGRVAGYSEDGLKQSIIAEENLVWIN